MSGLVDTYLSAEAGFMALLACARRASPEVAREIAPALEDAAQSVIWAYGEVVRSLEARDD